jgi:hypothetical protein
MTIQADGNIVFPNNQTLKSTASSGYIAIYGNGGGLYFGGTTTNQMYISSGGNVGIGTSSPSYLLTVSNTSFSGGANGLITLIGGSESSIMFMTTSYGADTNKLLIDNATGSMQFRVNSAERMRITSGGWTKASTNGTYRDGTNGHEFGDNSSADINHFTVWAQSSSCLGALVRIAGSRSSTNNTYKFINATNGNDTGIFNVLDSGNCQNTNSSYGGTSDVKLKQDIIDASSQWDDIKQIRVRKFRFKKQVEVDENAPYLLGVVAQEIETTSPNLVEEVADKNKDGTESTTKSVKYSVIYMKAVKALQEAMQRIETLESTITLLNERLTKAAL